MLARSRARLCTPPRLLVVFGLRGTLLEKVHATTPPEHLPPADHVSGPKRIWLRPGARELITELSAVCDLAVWSSTVPRNTEATVHALLPPGAPDGERPWPPSPLRFVLSRDATVPDRYRRGFPVDTDDEFATLKDPARLWRDHPEYTPARTVLVDDTPSKARLRADNFLWVRSFDEAAVAAGTDAALPQLRRFIQEELVPAPDVRALLPRHIPAGPW